jgi:hypothetical protein
MKVRVDGLHLHTYMKYKDETSYNCSKWGGKGVGWGGNGGDEFTNV